MCKPSFVASLTSFPYFRSPIPGLMKFFLQLFALVTVLLVVGCEAQHKTAVRHSRQPHFIDDIVMDSHNKTSSTANAVSRYVAPAPPPEEHKVAAEKGDAPAQPHDVTLDKTIPVTTDPEHSAILMDKYAALLGVASVELPNYSLYRFIEEWLGTEYHRGGCDKDGIDCSCFVQKLYTTVFGTDLVRTSAEQYKICQHLKRSEGAHEGDLVFFKIHSRHITHVGVYLMNDYFVHASSSQGVMISNLNDEYWKKYLAGVGRVQRTATVATSSVDTGKGIAH